MEKQQGTSTIKCSEAKANDSSSRLTEKDIGGIFIVHFIFLIIASTMAFWQLKNPRAVAQATDLSEQASQKTRKLSEKLFSIEDEIEETKEVEEDIFNEVKTSGSSSEKNEYIDSNNNVHPQDKKALHNLLKLQSKQLKLSQEKLINVTKNQEDLKKE